MHLLLLSNSTMPGEPYLSWARPHLEPFLDAADDVLFVPYAAVEMDYDDYTARVASALPQRRVTGIHTVSHRKMALSVVGAIIVGGGNTFSLLRRCQKEGLLGPIRDAVIGGTLYAGWSAGANLACPTIKTTNDMPIEVPDGLDALGLVPFQINAHFTSATLPGHGGESRVQRLQEFLVRNPGSPVIGLPEGTLLDVTNEKTVLRGNSPATIFRHGQEPVEKAPGPNPITL